MATTKTWSYTSATSDTRVLSPEVLSFSSNFAKREVSTKEVILVNTSSPIDRYETVRFGFSNIPNVYTGTGIVPGYQSVTKEGVNILAQVRETLTVVDTDLQQEVVLPFSAHIVFRLPKHAAVTSTEMVALLTRLIGSLYEDSDDTPAVRLNSLSRGVLLPRALA